LITVADIIDELENIAPSELADDRDPVGLQVGDTSAEVRRVCVAVDASNSVVNAAVQRKADLVITHHPLIYRPLSSITVGDPVSKRVIKLVQAKISFFVMHTNFDTAPGGMNDVLAAKLGVIDTVPLTNRREDKFYKIVVFVPEEAVEQVRDAMAEAGAGRIGQYTHCSFRTLGTGSFVPLPAAQPYIGTHGELEEVEEYRLEMICAGSWLDQVIAEMLDKHPYDEVAYDVYELANEPIIYGYGRVGTLDKESSLGEFAELVIRTLDVRFPRIYGDPEKTVRRVALCSGGGASHIREAVQLEADVYVTGDLKHHQIENAMDLGIPLIDAGHFETEKPGMVSLVDRLRKAFLGSDIEIEYIE
jgi:dinuclear metal center YbgI/SA1388 family protein